MEGVSCRHLTIPEDAAQFLEDEGLASAATNNKRKISTSTISSTHTFPSHSSSVSKLSSASSQRSVSPADFKATFVAGEAEYVEIPVALESYETLQCFGFNDIVAQEIWDRFASRTPDPYFEDDLFDFVSYYLDDPIFDAFTQHDDWTACMQNIGLRKELIDAILLPEYEVIRYTASCRHWVLEAMEDRFDGLVVLEKQVTAEVARLTALKSRFKRQGFESAVAGRQVGKPIFDIAITAEPSTKSGPISRSPETSKDTPNLTTANLTVPPMTMPGHTILWRAGRRSKLEKFYNVATQEFGIGVFAAMGSAPGDFDGATKTVHWTPQKEVADRYAGWAKQKAPISQLAMMQVAVPESWVQTLNKQYIWHPTEEWKKVIWYSRRDARLPRELRHIAEADLRIGNIATGKHVSYRNMLSPSEVGERNLLILDFDGQIKPCIQWAFTTSKGTEGFKENCRGNIWIHPLGAFKIPPQKSALPQ